MDKDKYLIMPRCSKYTHIQQWLVQMAEILGYNVVIYNKPNTDACRGRRASEILWWDDLLDYSEQANKSLKEFKKPLTHKLESDIIYLSSEKKRR